MLTPRESEVLGLVAEARSTKAIAQGLWLAERTVETQVCNILTKLDLPDSSDAHRRVLAVLAYLKASAGGLPAWRRGLGEMAGGTG